MKHLKSYLVFTILIMFTIVSCTQMQETEKKQSSSDNESVSQVLVTTAWLANNLSNANVRIIDRQDTIPADNFYAQGHIPGAIHMRTNAVKGTKVDVREMLILKDLIVFLEKNGVTEKNHVIVVGSAGKLPAVSRVFWALEYLGHKKVSVLDGGIEKWKAENRPITTDTPQFAPVTYNVNLQRSKKVTGEEIYESLGLFDKFNIVVVDSRKPPEVKGVAYSRNTKEVLGKVPGSTGLMFMALLQPETKEFKSADQIQMIFNKHGLTKDKTIYVMCVSGCFGSSIYLGARMLGYENVALYDGSWIEWINKGYPVEDKTGAISTPEIVNTSADEETSEGC
ncbi:MAG: rhodanese-like domain-containing protein [bacterium]